MFFEKGFSNAIEQKMDKVATEMEIEHRMKVPMKQDTLYYKMHEFHKKLVMEEFENQAQALTPVNTTISK